MMTPVEIIALVLMVAGIIKLTFITINPNTLLGFSKNFYSNKKVVQTFGIIAGSIVLYYLLQELTIVQIIATMAFTALLFMIGLASDIEPIIKKYETQIKKRTIWKNNWLYISIWIILIIWAGKELVF